jgi:oxygen-independent coproporphyrinogen-3 oxidase
MGYIEHATAGEAVSNEHEVAREALAFEFMLNALRLRAGFRTALFVERTGLPLSTIEPALRRAEASRLIERDAFSVRPSAKGFDFLSDLQQLFLPAA